MKTVSEIVSGKRLSLIDMVDHLEELMNTNGFREFDACKDALSLMRDNMQDELKDINDRIFDLAQEADEDDSAQIDLDDASEEQYDVEQDIVRVEKLIERVSELAVG